MNRTVCALLLLGALLATSVGGLSDDKKVPPLRKAAVDCPQGDCCLVRLALVTSGKLMHKLGKPYDCPTGATARGAGSLELKPLKSTGRPCDEDNHKLIPEGSQLNAAIHAILRNDDLAHICGTFTIQHDNKIFFQGDLELCHRVNTHYKPYGPDACDQKNFLQGWLSGKGVADSPANGVLLRAMLVARTSRLPENTGYTLDEVHLNGVLIKCKQ